ncbi:MAG: hypothetical protein ABJ275_02880 [Maricaulaceae bacterium]
MQNLYILPNDFEEFAKYLPNNGMGELRHLDGLLRLDISELRKKGVLSNHTPCSMEIARNGETVGVMKLQASHDFLMVSGASNFNINQHIPLTQTPCNYGGSRKWFLCPDCDRRVGVLYYQTQFKCRHCTNLYYESQYKPESSRLFSKARKIRRDLGGSENMSEPFPERPKGMHVNTYLIQMESYWLYANQAFQAYKAS